MSIRPEFAERIFDRSKRFELRRRIFADTVETVVVYVTHPVGRVVGEFSVQTVHTLPILQLWERVKQSAGIERERFFAYFLECSMGHAIEVGEILQYESPLSINCFSERAPQSYMYLG